METLRSLLEERFGKEMNATIGRIIVSENMWDKAMGLVSDADAQVAFRAAWALQWAMEHAGRPLTDYSCHIVGTFLNSQNGSVQRIYSKLLLEVMRKTDFDDITNRRIAEKSFDLLLDAKTKVAVKVWLMEISESLSGKIDYVAENLAECILRLSEAPDCTPAITSHARKVLLRIRNVQPRI